MMHENEDLHMLHQVRSSTTDLKCSDKQCQVMLIDIVDTH
jgi:hypothetical protein